MGSVLFAALLVPMSTFVVDLAYTWLDPRVKYS
jgi:ABC-type dipeptide/oligopeptide/nickel transport system permease component